VRILAAILIISARMGSKKASICRKTGWITVVII